MVPSNSYRSYLYALVTAAVTLIQINRGLTAGALRKISCQHSIGALFLGDNCSGSCNRYSSSHVLETQIHH